MAKAKYNYTAVTADGSTVTGVMQSESPLAVRAELESQDLQPVRLQVKESIWQLELTSRKVKRKEIMHFSRQLAVFARAGVPLLQGLQAIAEETDDKILRKTLFDMIDALRAGDTFAAAARAHPEAFPDYYVGMLGAAELTGNLDDVLDQLADYLERDIDARQRVTSALVYPSIVFAMAIVTVVVLTAFVIPRFRDFFDEFHAKLPLPTRVLVSITDFLARWWILLSIGLLVAVVGGILIGHTAWGHKRRDQLLLKLPVVGDLVNGVLLERFCRVLAAMLQAGVPLPDSMHVARDSTNNTVYREGLDRAREAMLRGEGLAAPLAATGLFPASARQMMRVGEDTGTLDEQLHTAAVYFDRELDYRLKRFTSLFEPAVILFVGVVVGFVAIALVSAMYGIYKQVKI